ncbi:MAG: VPLPA-CTERM sorting domain-containing protein, partial [bacterium]
YNVAQNSQNLGFGYSSNPQTPGLYTISLSASNGGGEVASTSINVRVVPLPAGLPLLLGAFGGLALLRRKRRQVA